MEKYKILIVEDDVDLREGLSFSFSDDGYDVTETGTKKDKERNGRGSITFEFFRLYHYQNGKDRLWKKSEKLMYWLLEEMFRGINATSGRVFMTAIRSLE